MINHESWRQVPTLVLGKVLVMLLTTAVDANMHRFSDALIKVILFHWLQERGVALPQMATKDNMAATSSDKADVSVIQHMLNSLKVYTNTS